jgi:hypothetical protein
VNSLRRTTGSRRNGAFQNTYSPDPLALRFPESRESAPATDLVADLLQAHPLQIVVEKVLHVHKKEKVTTKKLRPCKRERLRQVEAETKRSEKRRRQEEPTGAADAQLLSWRVVAGGAASALRLIGGGRRLFGSLGCKFQNASRSRLGSADVVIQRSPASTPPNKFRAAADRDRRDLRPRRQVDHAAANRASSRRPI